MPIPKGKLDYLQVGCHKIMTELGHSEMWGVELVPDNPNHTPTRLILAKFLQANAGDAFKALKQLRAVLIWRKQTKPRELMKAVFDGKKFAGLGYIHDQQSVDSRAVVIFNLYGHPNRVLMDTPQGFDE